jgi:hypothetical protein
MRALLALLLAFATTPTAAPDKSGWTMGGKPAVAHPYDEEFEGGLSRWTIGGNQLSTAIDPYATFTTSSGDWRYSLTLRPGWLLVQPVANGSYIDILTMGITVPSSFTVVARMGFAQRVVANETANDASIGIYVSASSGGARDANNSVNAYLHEADGTNYQAQFDVTSAGVNSASTVQGIQQGQPIRWETVLLHKRATAWDFWIADSSGNWMNIGAGKTYSGSATLDRVGVLVANSSTTYPGNLVLGIDFIRFYEGVVFP